MFFEFLLFVLTMIKFYVYLSVCVAVAPRILDRRSTSAILTLNSLCTTLLPGASSSVAYSYVCFARRNYIIANQYLNEGRLLLFQGLLYVTFAPILVP